MDKIVQIKKDVKLQEWSMMVRTCRASGMTVGRWCNENGINLKTYYYRLRKVREYLCEETEVHPIVPISVPIEENDNNSMIKLSSLNISAEIPLGVSPDVMKAIIEAIKC